MPLQNANNILPLAQGGVMAQMRRISLLPHQPCDPVNRPAHRHNVAASGAPPRHLGGTMRSAAGQWGSGHETGER
jgi:hypothetical protein